MDTNPLPDETVPENPLAPPAEPPLASPAQQAFSEAPENDASQPGEPPLEIGERAPILSSEEPASDAELPASGSGELPSGQTDELTLLAEASQKARLPQPDEDRMGALLKEAILGGRAGVARAIEVLPKVPWIVAVRVVETVWAELTAGFRTQLLAGLAKDESDAARRVRLSLARALFRLDVPVALKLALGVVKEIRDKETGALNPRHAQIFANVFIGRAKPWLVQLPLAELKPGDIDLLVHCAVVAVFTVPHPPLAQLGVLKWAHENGRLGKLHEVALEAAKKGIARWSGKWQGSLSREIGELPEELLAVMKSPPADAPSPVAEATFSPEGISPELASEASTPGTNGEDRDENDDDEDEDERDRPIAKERPVYEPRPQKPALEGDPREPRESQERESSRERPVYTPRHVGGGNATQKFNLGDTLRQIESHVQSLRNDLAAAQAKTRQKDDDRRRRPERSESAGIQIVGAPTPDELARLNQQLEARNSELQAQIADFKQHAEDLAQSTGAMSGEPVEDAGAQLRTLLALKLQEDFADFLALEKESNDLVIQQHYKGLLRHVFEVLQQLEVPLKAEAQ